MVVSPTCLADINIDSLLDRLVSVYNDRTDRGNGGLGRNTMSTSHDDAVVHSHEPREPTDDPVIARTSGEPPDLLTLLDDEYARRILGLLSEGSHRGRELSERCEFSRPTVYRRLNRLEDAGLVRSELRIDPDGNHCKEFFLVRDALRISFDDGRLTVAAHTETVDDAR